MTGSVAAITQPVQLHTESLQIADGWSTLRLATQQANGGETEALAGSGLLLLATFGGALTTVRRQRRAA